MRGHFLEAHHAVTGILMQVDWCHHGSHHCKRLVLAMFFHYHQQTCHYLSDIDQIMITSSFIPVVSDLGVSCIQQQTRFAVTIASDNAFHAVKK